jgi:hypothetical protein
MSNCVVCPVGKYAPQAASTCTFCELGKYSASNETVQCSDCPFGTFTREIGGCCRVCLGHLCATSDRCLCRANCVHQLRPRLFPGLAGLE